MVLSRPSTVLVSDFFRVECCNSSAYTLEILDTKCTCYACDCSVLNIRLHFIFYIILYCVMLFLFTCIISLTASCHQKCIKTPKRISNNNVIVHWSSCVRGYFAVVSKCTKPVNREFKPHFHQYIETIWTAKPNEQIKIYKTPWLPRNGSISYLICMRAQEVTIARNTHDSEKHTPYNGWWIVLWKSFAITCVSDISQTFYNRIWEL